MNKIQDKFNHWWKFHKGCESFIDTGICNHCTIEMTNDFFDMEQLLEDIYNLDRYDTEGLKGKIKLPKYKHIPTVTKLPFGHNTSIQEMKYQAKESFGYNKAIDDIRKANKLNSQGRTSKLVVDKI